MQIPEAIVFDADGTLLNSFELIYAAYAHVAVTHSLPAPSPEEVRAQLGKPLPDIFHTFYPDENVQELLHTNSVFIAANTMKAEAYAGVDELLQNLFYKGVKLAILTSGGQKIVDILEHHGYGEYFTSIVHHERIRHLKPHPEGFLLAARECETVPEKTIMVGDTTFDIETGQNAGALATIAVTHGFGTITDLQKAGPDFIVKDIFEVATVLDKLLA